MIFQESVHMRHSLTGITFQMLEVVDKSFLERTCLMEELKAVIRKGVGDKSHGSDDFNMSFFKAYWEIVKVDLLRAAREFHRSSRILKVVLASFVALVPKVENPLSLDEFRPIFFGGKCV